MILWVSHVWDAVEEWRLEWTFDLIKRLTVMRENDFEWLQIEFHDSPMWCEQKSPAIITPRNRRRTAPRVKI